MTPPQSTLVVGVYHVRPDKRDEWLETWQHLAVIAKSRPECQIFDLDVDGADRNECRVISTWSSDRGFDRFARAVGLPWIERHLDYSESPPSYSHFPLSNRTVGAPGKVLFTHA